MKYHTMQVDILSRILAPTDRKPINVEKTITVIVLEEVPTAKASDTIGPLSILMVDDEVWLQPDTPEYDVNPAGLHDGFTLYTTALKHWRMAERSDARTPNEFAALHSETSRMVGKVLHLFGHHPKSTFKAHEQLSFDRLAICKAADLVNRAETALLDALPYMNRDQVQTLIDKHFKTLADGAEPARLLTNLAPDALG